LLEKTFAQHDGHAVEQGKRTQDFANIVQEGRGQQVRVGLTGSLQPFEHLLGVGLFRVLHPAKKDNLGRGEMRKKRLGLNPLAAAGQGIPELAGAINETGKRTHREPSITCQGLCEKDL
jgi:hypothetical protein